MIYVRDYFYLSSQLEVMQQSLQRPSHAALTDRVENKAKLSSRHSSALGTAQREGLPQPSSLCPLLRWAPHVPTLQHLDRANQTCRLPQEFWRLLGLAPAKPLTESQNHRITELQNHRITESQNV